jgi:hypothetical protein
VSGPAVSDRGGWTIALESTRIADPLYLECEFVARAVVAFGTFFLDPREEPAR